MSYAECPYCKNISVGVSECYPDDGEHECECESCDRKVAVLAHTIITYEVRCSPDDHDWGEWRPEESSDGSRWNIRVCHRCHSYEFKQRKNEEE